MADHAASDTASPRGAWWAALALLSAALLGPLLIADVPPILDYPNHLARFVLLAAGPEDPVLGPVFTPNWAIIPNLASDVIGPVLVRLLPVHVAGRSLLGGILLLNLAGVLALHRSLFGRRSFWPLASGLVGYNSTFLLGFMNWQISCGLAMLFAAAWLTWRERRPIATIAGASVASIVLFFCHPMGLMFFLVLIGSAEAHAMWHGRAVFVRFLLVRPVLLLPVLLGPMLLSILTPLRNEPATADWMDAQAKLVQVASPFINYFFLFDAFTTLLVYGGVVLGVAAGWFVLAPRAVVAAAALAILYVACPFNLMGTSFVDTRIAIMFGFLLFAAVDPAGLPRQARRVVAAGLVALFAVRMAVVADVWVEQRRDLADLRAVIAAVPPGALVYVTTVPREEAQTYWDTGPRSRMLSNILRTDYHLPALLLIERGAFWPLLFANPAQQPIRLRPAYERLAREEFEIPSHADLVADPDRGSAAFRDFDFVLMLEADADPDLRGFVPRCLALVSWTDFAALFRVRRDSGACVTVPPPGKCGTAPC
jgi:hypothetical protein